MEEIFYFVEDCSEQEKAASHGWLKCLVLALNYDYILGSCRTILSGPPTLGQKMALQRLWHAAVAMRRAPRW